LKFDGISILSNKSSVPDEFISLFQESDRHEERSASDDGATNTVEYRAERAIILHRLDLLGYTSQTAREHFEEWLTAERDHYSELTRDGEGRWASHTFKVLQQVDYAAGIGQSRRTRLYPTHARTPDVLVNLKLETHRETIFQNPGGRDLWREAAAAINIRTRPHHDSPRRSAKNTLHYVTRFSPVPVSNTV